MIISLLTCLLLPCVCLLLVDRVVVDVVRMGRGGWWAGVEELVDVAELGLLLLPAEEGRFNR